MDTNYYNEHNLTLALHPSETELRLMARIVAFILNANDDLVFCKGIDVDDEPSLWEKGYDGDINLWIELGQPDEKRIKKACGRSKKVIIYTYQENMATPWFAHIEGILSRFKNLSIVHLDFDEDLDVLAKRGMNLQCNISDTELTLIDKDRTVTVNPQIWK
jgi:uncharacterized protein YaeQ